MFARTQAQQMQALGTSPALAAACPTPVLGLPYQKPVSAEINLGNDTRFWGREAHKAVAPMLDRGGI